MSQIIRFKSTPQNFRKEFLGLKKNTVRKCDDVNDKRFILLNEWIEGKSTKLIITIEETTTQEIFMKWVTDVTIYEGLYIISWGKDVI